MERPCVYLGVGMQRWTCVAVSAYPARGPGRVNGAGAGVLWRAFLLSSPTHEPSKEARVCSLAAPGVLDLDPYPPPRHRPPPPPPRPLNSFRDFRNPPRPLREASSLRAASPRPGSKSPPGARLDREGRRRAKHGGARGDRLPQL